MADEKVMTSQSMIKTTVEIPDTVMEKFLRERFPELGPDCRIDSVGSNYAGGIRFHIEHTIQKPVDIPLIQLTMQEDSDDATPED